VLRSLGWQTGCGALSPGEALELAEPTWDVLYRLGAVTERYGSSADDVTTPEGRLLARAALRSL
jgi:hypothetical protein